jgi:hypothetical protein
MIHCLNHVKPMGMRNELKVSKGEGLVSVNIWTSNKSGDVEKVEYVTISPQQSRELAAELIRLADEIEGVLRHSNELYSKPINLNR